MKLSLSLLVLTYSLWYQFCFFPVAFVPKIFGLTIDFMCVWLVPHMKSLQVRTDSHMCTIWVTFPNLEHQLAPRGACLGRVCGYIYFCFCRLDINRERALGKSNRWPRARIWKEAGFFVAVAIFFANRERGASVGVVTPLETEGTRMILTNTSSVLFFCIELTS